MGLVLAFARLNGVGDVINETPIALNFNQQSRSTTTVPNDIQFKRDRTVQINGMDYIQYSCSFSTKHKKHILVLGTTVEEYYVPHHFKALKRIDSDIVFFKESTDVATKFIKIINHFESKYFEPIDFDFLEIAKKVHTVVGSWFKVPSANISSQSIHGPDILGSDEFIALCKLGKISSLNVSYQYLGGTYIVIISGKGSIYLRSKLEPKDHETLLLLDLFYTLIV